MLRVERGSVLWGLMGWLDDFLLFVTAWKGKLKEREYRRETHIGDPKLVRSWSKSALPVAGVG